MRTLALLALLWAPFPPPSAQDISCGAGTPFIVSSILEASGNPADLAALIARLGPEAIGPTAWLLAEGRLAPEVAAAAKASLAAQPPEALRAHARAVASSPLSSDAARRLALELLAGCAGPDDIELCAALASPAEGEAGVPRARRLAFEQALRAIAARAPESRFALAGLLGGFDGALVGPAVRALAAERSAESLALLADLLGRVEGADGLLLAELAGLGVELGRPADERVARQVRGLLGDCDRHVAVLAVQAAAALQDTAAIGELIGLLSHADPALRAAAEAALVQLARKHYRGGPEAWERWYQGELAWWSDEAPRALDELGARDPARAVAALRELAQHRLHREESAEAVADVLARPERDLVVVACSILGHLGSPRAVPELLDALERDDPRVVDAAARALRAITGLDLPAEADAWDAAVGPESVSASR
jgi:hypothetical protein